MILSIVVCYLLAVVNNNESRIQFIKLSKFHSYYKTHASSHSLCILLLFLFFSILPLVKKQRFPLMSFRCFTSLFSLTDEARFKPALRFFPLSGDYFSFSSGFWFISWQFGSDIGDKWTVFLRRSGQVLRVCI